MSSIEVLHARHRLGLGRPGASSPRTRNATRSAGVSHLPALGLLVAGVEQALAIEALPCHGMRGAGYSPSHGSPCLCIY